MVSPCLKKCQNTRENSRGPWPRIVACLRRPTANLSWLLPSSRSKVSISPTSGRQICLQMWRPRMTLSKILAWRSAMLNERCYGSSESTAHYFPTHLLSDNFLLSTCPLLSAYFLGISCYKRMRLTTSPYGICFRKWCCSKNGGWKKWDKTYWYFVWVFLHDRFNISLSAVCR